MATCSDNLQPRRNTLIWCAALALASAVTYIPARNAGWFFDSLLVQSSPNAASVSKAWGNLFAAPFMPGQEFTEFTFALNHALNTSLGREGFDASAFVITNVLIHIANVILLFFLCMALCRRHSTGVAAPPWIIASMVLLFGVHPLATSSVTYIVQRRGVLAATFLLSASLCYLRMGTGAMRSRRFAWATPVILLSWLSAKSSTIGMITPVALLALEFVFRFASTHSPRRLILATVALAAFSLFGGFVVLWRMGSLDPTSFSFRTSPTLEHHVDFTPLEYTATQARAVLKYQQLILWPASGSLCLDHDFAVSRNLAAPTAWLPFVWHCAIISFAFVLARKRNAVAAWSILLAYLAFIPWMVVPQPILFAEYRGYIPLIATVLIAVSIGSSFQSRRSQLISAAAGLCACIAMGCFTWNRNSMMADIIALWQDVSKKYPDRFRAQYNLGNALYQAGNYEESLEHYRRAARIDPADFRPHLNLANALLKLGQTRKAAAEYVEVIRRKPDHAAARHALSAIQSSGIGPAGRDNRTPDESPRLSPPAPQGSQAAPTQPATPPSS